MLFWVSCSVGSAERCHGPLVGGQPALQPSLVGECLPRHHPGDAPSTGVARADQTDPMTSPQGQIDTGEAGAVKAVDGNAVGSGHVISRVWQWQDTPTGRTPGAGGQRRSHGNHMPPVCVG